MPSLIQNSGPRCPTSNGLVHLVGNLLSTSAATTSIGITTSPDLGAWAEAALIAAVCVTDFGSVTPSCFQCVPKSKYWDDFMDVLSKPAWSFCSVRIRAICFMNAGNISSDVGTGDSNSHTRRMYPLCVCEIHVGVYAAFSRTSSIAVQSTAAS